jgi:predicted transcriptional regulator
VSPRRPAHPPADATPRLQDTVRLSADGLAKVLGDLEARVLRTVWDLGAPVPARAVYERVAEAHPVASLTVITVLNKLVEKRVLERHKEHDLFHYSARMTEAEFVAHASRRVVEGILSFQPEAVAASMVDVLAERDPEQLAELARLIRRRMGEAADRPDEPPSGSPSPAAADRRGKA